MAQVCADNIRIIRHPEMRMSFIGFTDATVEDRFYEPELEASLRLKSL